MARNYAEWLLVMLPSRYISELHYTVIIDVAIQYMIALWLFNNNVISLCLCGQCLRGLSAITRLRGSAFVV